MTARPMTRAPAALAEGVRVLRNRRNRGYGAALKRGIAAAQYEWILIIDADGTYPATAIPELLALADTNEMVVGARITKRRTSRWSAGRPSGS
jgi:glycosyltransferase involved in cell wall biosynthesis